MNKQSSPVPIRSARSPLFLIGRDRAGHWVAQDQSGLRGGLFVGRAEAIRFALFENGNRPQALIMVAGLLELDLNDRSEVAPDQLSRPEAFQRRVA